MKSIPENYLKLDGKFITVCTDMAEMYWCLERSYGRHMNAGFPTVVYNKVASMTYDNSFYNKSKNIEHALYRKKVEKYLKNYDGNSGFHLQPDYIYGVEGRDWITDDSDSDSDNNYNKYNNLLENIISEQEPEPEPEPEQKQKFGTKLDNRLYEHFKNFYKKLETKLETKHDEINISIEVITDLYKTVLLRKPDDDGLDHWVNKYDNGMSKEEIKNIMMNSKEGLAIQRYKANQMYTLSHNEKNHAIIPNYTFNKKW